jgi:DNA polymerase elongation subunit (family B)
MAETALARPLPSPEYERLVNSSAVNGTGRIECFLMDVKTFIIKQIKQSAVELFVRSFDGYYYRFYMTHDPYFYLLLDTWNHAPGIKEELMEKCVNDWGGKLVKKIEAGNYHVWGQFGDNFLQSSPALVVTTYYPTDVPKCRSIIEKSIKGVQGREWDIPFHIRVMIDWGLNPGKAYSFAVKDGFVVAFESMKNISTLPKIPEKCAFDIEVKKEQLKKPKPGDPVNLLGYQYIDLGHVVNNIAVHKVEIDSFWMGVKDGKMTPLTPEEAEAMKGAKYKPVLFEAINVATEKDLINHWKSFLVEYRPKVMGGYYCDKFDWGHLSENGKKYGINFETILQFDKFEKAYTRDGYFFIDAIKFITRDSYLSKGNQSLKDVAKILLGIDPLEVDHEEVVHILAKIEKEWGNPDSTEYDLDRCKKEAQALAYYCASDVYLTYILVNTQVTDLDVSLSTIIPMGVFESARKARGPMVEYMMLKLMHEQGMIAPNKANPPEVTVNPASEVDDGKGVMVEYGKQEEKFWARCITKRWMVENCKECKNFSDCKKVLSLDPLVDKTRFFCQKMNDEMSAAPAIDMAVLKYKFEGAFVEAFNIGVFKDNCPIKITIKPAKLDTLQKKMKIAVLTEIKKMQSKGIVVDNVSKYLASIDESFSKIRSKCKKKDSGDLEYYGLIAIIHIDVASMYPNIIITYNLQPHGAVTQTMCDACHCHHSEGEPCCWIEMPWNAVYVSHVIPPDIREKADKALLKMKGEKGEADKIRKKAYGEFIGRAVAAGKMKKPKKLEYTFKIPRTARFCQKAHKFFARAVKDFRDKRYEFKYAEKDVYVEIEGIKEKWRDQMPPDMKENVKRLRERITAAEKEIEGILTMDVVNKNDVIKVVAETKKIKKEYKKVLEEWLGKIPAMVKSEIESLEMKAVFNRNSQLTYKVLLNAIYGWLDSAGARLLSIEVTGSITIKGQDIIKWATDYMRDFALPIEDDSLDYSERLVLQDPDGMVRVIPIGEFVRTCLDHGPRVLTLFNEEKAPAPPGWKALSVRKDGVVEWRPVLGGLRQRTDRELRMVKTPFGSIKTTESHSLFRNRDGIIEPVEVKHLNADYIVHACSIPPVEICRPVNLARHSSLCDNIRMFVHVPVSSRDSEKWESYPISKIRLRRHDDPRARYYQVPIDEYDGGDPDPDIKVSSFAGTKFPARIPMTDELAELCGWYVAEGYAMQSNGQTYAGLSQQVGEKLDRILYLCSVVGKYFKDDFEPHAALGDRRSMTYRIGLDNTFFSHLFLVMGCGAECNTKRIPPEILSAPVNIKEAFVRGYFGGDGCTTGKRMRFDTSSDGLRDDLFVMGKILGYVVSLHETVSTTTRKPMHVIYFMNRDNWILGSKNHYKHVESGSTIGLQAKSITTVQKSDDYVYDISVEGNNNFVTANGGILAHNTDGNFSAIPADLPREITIKGKDKDGEDVKSKINVFNSTINADVKEKFTNYNNYKWDDATQTFVSDPQCFIKFDYDGPFSMLFIQGEKRYTAYDRDKDDPTEQKIAEVKGMDRKRKGELPVIKAVEEWVDGAYKEASSYDEVYGNAVKAVETYVEQIKNRSLDPHLLFEARDITSVSASQKAFAVLDDLERKGSWNPEKVPQCTDLIKKSVSKDIAKRVESAFGKKLSTRHAWCCLRIVDLGISVDDEEPVQWIISKFPSNVGSITQRVIPTILFNADVATIRKYLKRWIGYDCPEKFTTESIMRDIIDWDYYLDRMAKKIHKIVLNPYSRQKDYITRKEIHDEVANLKANLGIKQQKPDSPGKSSGGLLKFFAQPGDVADAAIVERGEKAKPQFKGVAKIGKSYDLRDFL